MAAGGYLVEELELPFPPHVTVPSERDPLGTFAECPHVRRRPRTRARPLPLRGVRLARFLLRLTRS